MTEKKTDFSCLDFLVVENNAFLCKLIMEILCGFGAGQVRTATNVPDALHLVDRCTPDVIFCAWTLPQAGGLNLLRALRRDNNGRYPPVPVIAVGDPVTDGHIAWVLGEGADSYVVKPFSPHTLMVHILKVAAPDGTVHYIDV